MNEIIQEDLVSAIMKIRTTKPKGHPESVRYYLNKILFECKECSDDAYKRALKVFREDELWEYPVVYFIAIVKNKQLEIIKHIAKEKRALGDVPR